MVRRTSKYIRDARRELLCGIGVPKPRPFSPDPFQLEAIKSLADGNDTLVVAPTGTGKTYIAVEGIRQAILRGERSIYTAPLKALSNTKYAEFKKFFAPATVGLLTGDRKIEGDADVVVATTEIYRNDLYNYGEVYSLVVLDELHYLADAQRGPVWEESIILSPSSARLLMLSASISNAEEIASWIGEVRGRKVKIIIEERRPVEMRLGFLHPELGVIPLQNEKGKVFSEVSNFYDQGGLQRFNRGGTSGSGPGRPWRGRAGGHNK